MSNANLRNFINAVQNNNSARGPISPINTISSIEFDFGNRNSAAANSLGASLLRSAQRFGFGRGITVNESSPVSIDENLIYYIQDMTIPQISIQSGDAINSPFQSSSTVKTSFGEAQSFDMTLINTTKPIQLEFLKWLNLTRTPRWFGEYPFPTADVTVTFKEKKVQYLLFGCRPTAIELVQPTQRAEAPITRKVTFNVDFVHAIPVEG